MNFGRSARRLGHVLRILETDSLALERFSRDRVDVYTLYDRFAEGREGVENVFEYVPQEPYTRVKEGRDQIEDAEAAGAVRSWRTERANLAWRSV
ncbi:hypothetical protein ACKVMT_12490 [Halobacteriales archaeon Cl-PHB]